jgi:hypothetical protein
MNLPDYQFLAAPLWLITGLHVLTLSLHLAVMNFLLGGIVVVVWGKLNGQGDHSIAGKFVRIFPSIMATTVTLGVAPLLFLQAVYPRQMYPAAIVMGVFWLLVIPAVIASYYSLYGASLSKKTTDQRRRIYLLAALIGLVYASLLYSAVFSMAERPDLVRQLYARNQSGILWNPEARDYAFRWLHMVLGAMTVGGGFAGLLSRSDPQAFKVCRGFFLWGMIFAALAGFGYLFSLGEYLRPLMRTPAVWALNTGIILSAASLHFYFKKQFVPSSLTLFVSLLLMVYTRHTVRLLRLEGVYDPGLLRVTPQWWPFLVFLVFLLTGLGVVAYMLRLFFRASPAPSAAVAVTSPSEESARSEPR